MHDRKRTHSEYEAVAVLEDVAKEPDPAPHHAYEAVRHVELLRREVALLAVHRPEQAALDAAAEAPAPAEGLLVHAHEEDVVDELLGAVRPSPSLRLSRKRSSRPPSSAYALFSMVRISVLFAYAAPRSATSRSSGTKSWASVLTRIKLGFRYIELIRLRSNSINPERAS